ncbi:unnamed protein product [Caenorhabditis bovis]|uniref:C-type lectin domain-containing protein n=1 Tax=Caenorhabditis bovis TaxID=2654633 RepID=A0A8S1ELD5_9PELO|nr:unnamed protein product [Caenorhabditis bovis]
MRFFFVLSALFLLASATSLRVKRQCGCTEQPTCSCQQSTPQLYTCACQQQAPMSSCSCSQQTVQVQATQCAPACQQSCTQQCQSNTQCLSNNSAEFGIKRTPIRWNDIHSSTMSINLLIIGVLFQVLATQLTLGQGITCPPEFKTYTRLNGMLTGFDNAAQRKIAADNAKEVLKQLGLTSGAFWIGAYRKKECQVSNWKKVKACLPAEKNSIEWTDRNTTSTDGFNFRKGQPDYNMGNQNAVYMVVGEDVVDRYGVWKNEEMDDVR